MMPKTQEADPQSILEQWIEREFEQAVGGLHTIEQLRQSLHERYADNPKVRAIIDRIAARMQPRPPHADKP